MRAVGLVPAVRQLALTKLSRTFLRPAFSNSRRFIR
jgi:hypothetical protein